MNTTARFTVALAILAVLSLALPAGATVDRFYVSTTGSDDSLGTSLAKAWRTLDHAMSVMDAGDSCSVEGGHYNTPGLKISSYRDGTSGAGRIKLYAAAPCTLSNGWNLPDSAFVAATGHGANTYRLYPLSGTVGVGVTLRDIHQAKYNDILVNDDNRTRLTLKAADGPLQLAKPATVAAVDTIAGAWIVVNDTLFVRTLDGTAPSTATIDLWAMKSLVCMGITHDYIVIQGFTFLFSTGGTMVLFEGTASYDTLRNCAFRGDNYQIQGTYNVALVDTVCHAWSRSASTWRWDTGAGGSGTSISGKHTLVKGGLYYHNNNLMSVSADSCTVDGVVMHGTANHALMPSALKRLVMRNTIEYNAQDALYVDNCSDMLVENCSLFSGFTMQGALSGPITIRNSLLTLTYPSDTTSTMITFTGTAPAGAESLVTLDHDLFLNAVGDPRAKIFEHVGVDDYSLADYLARMISNPSEVFCTVTDCIESDSDGSTILVGGAWDEETDTWNFRIAGPGSAALDTGASIGTVTDFEGQSRPMGAGFDIGADEYYVGTGGGGACCIGTGCGIAADQAACEAAGGVYLGDGTSCAGAPCAGATGACCFEDGTCKLETQIRCEGTGGTWSGGGTTCTPNPCPQAPTGACCLSDQTCVVKSALQCATLGGTYHGDAVPCGATCSTTPSPYPWPGGHRFGLYLGKYNFATALPYIELLVGSPDSLWFQQQIAEVRGWHQVKPSTVASCLSSGVPGLSQCYECYDSHCFDYVPWDSCCYWWPGTARGTSDTAQVNTTELLTVFGYDAIRPDSVTHKTLTGHMYGNNLDSLFSYVDWYRSAFPDEKEWRLHDENETPIYWLDTPTRYLELADTVRAHIRETCADCELGISFALPGLGGGTSPTADSWWTAIASHPNSFDFVDLHYLITRTPPDTILSRWQRSAPGKKFVSLEVGVVDTLQNGLMPDMGGTFTKQATDIPKLFSILFAAGFHRLSMYLVDTDIGKLPEVFLHNALVDDDGQIKPAFYAYQTMIRKVDGFTSCIKIADGQFRYFFDGGREPVTILWSGNVPTQLFSDRVTVTTYNGTSYHTCRESLEIDPNGPIYVENFYVTRW